MDFIIIKVFNIILNFRYANYYYDDYPLPAPGLYDYYDYGSEGSGADDGVEGSGEDAGDGSGGSDDGVESSDLGDEDSSEELPPPQETW